VGFVTESALRTRRYGVTMGFPPETHAFRRRRPQLLPYPPVAAAISPCGARGVAVTYRVSVVAVTDSPMSRRERVACWHRVLRPQWIGPRAAWNDSPVVICPHCGSSRLIPLTFASYRREDRHEGRSDEPVRPVAKCVGCGEQIYTSPTLNRALASSQ
jgi:hypothetical protein